MSPTVKYLADHPESDPPRQGPRHRCPLDTIAGALVSLDPMGLLGVHEPKHLITLFRQAQGVHLVPRCDGWMPKGPK